MQNVTHSESDGRLSEKHAIDRQAVQAHSRQHEIKVKHCSSFVGSITMSHNSLSPRSSQADCLQRNTAMDNSIGVSEGVTGLRLQ